MCLVIPGVKLDLAPGIVVGVFVRTALRVIGRQVREGMERLLVQPLALERGPLLERGIVTEQELRKEVATIERRSLDLSLRTGVAARRTTVWVRGAGGEQGREGADVQPVVAGRIELNSVAGNEEKRRISGMVPDGLAEGGERLA